MQARSRSRTKSWKCICSQHWTRRTPTQEICIRGLNLRPFKWLKCHCSWSYWR
jgi:hypothetical protein